VTSFARLLASGFGAGLSPVFPGTAGTAAAIPFALLLALLPPWGTLAAVAVSLPLGAWVCGRAARGDPDSDPGWIVFDEMVGFWISVLWVSPGIATYTAAFFLFRLFDIIKPPPARWFDSRWKGGWGILLDDVAAGVMTWAVLWILLRFSLL
jgi:phosphatidylglycerophosphatase A